RHCELPPGSVLTRARCKVRRGSEGDLLEQQRVAKADVDRRRATQPLSQPNSGSVFVNPPGDFAGRLIEQAGLKGTVRGGAQISERHANFIVNLGTARAADVVELIALARKTVHAASGVELGLGAGQARRWSTGSPAFALRAVKVTGFSHAEEPELPRRSGLAIRENLFRIDLPRAARAIEAHPWISSARLERRFADTIL